MLKKVVIVIVVLVVVVANVVRTLVIVVLANNVIIIVVVDRCFVVKINLELIPYNQPTLQVQHKHQRFSRREQGGDSCTLSYQERGRVDHKLPAANPGHPG